MVKGKNYSRKLSRETIWEIAEAYCDGMTQAAIAEKYRVSQPRISQLQKTEEWQQAIEYFDRIYQKASTQYAMQQRARYAEEFDRWLEQSRQMAAKSADTYQKIMKSVNDALDAAQSNPNKIEAADNLRNIPPLVKAAIDLQKELDRSLNLRLGIDEINKRILQGK